MEPRNHVPDAVRYPLDRRGFLGLSLGTGAGLAAAGAFSPAFARAAVDRSAERAGSGRATNVIFMVSDGMSFGTLSLAEIVRRVRDGKSTSWTGMWAMPGVRRSVMRTASADSLVTDSSAGSSAWGCGEHINNDAVNFTPDKKTPVPILVQASQNGKKTGLVTTTRVTHATPAGFIANCPSRNYEGIIAEQIIARGVDVCLGGGAKYFPEKLLAGARDTAVLRTVADFENFRARPPESGRVLGIFEQSHLLYECDRGKADPALWELASAALQRLSRGSDGFVLQIEGGRVDHAAHANDAGSLVGEQLAFDRTLGAVLEWMNGRDDTLLIVTTDHGNANPGLTLYGPESYRGIERLCKVRHSFEWLFEKLELKLSYDDPVDASKSAGDERAATLIEEATGVSLTKAEVHAFTESLKGHDTEHFAPMSRASSVLGSCLANYLGVGFISPNHTSDFVEVTAIGPGSDLIGPFIDNIELHGVMTRALDLAPARAL
ncbi:MAG: alkaline phosphatase [Phycisphaerales bacterium]|nr:alkaline phosphatase [Planctomycetota bacterium]